MYHTGLDPLTMEPVYTARDLREKRLMKALIFYWDPQYWPLAREALRKAGRRELVGRGPRALVPPGPEGAPERARPRTNRGEIHKRPRVRSHTRPR
jgi:hypothetical protein